MRQLYTILETPLQYPVPPIQYPVQPLQYPERSVQWDQDTSETITVISSPHVLVRTDTIGPVYNHYQLQGAHATIPVDTTYHQPAGIPICTNHRFPLHINPRSENRCTNVIHDFISWCAEKILICLLVVQNAFYITFVIACMPVTACSDGLRKLV
jgi:hypothetical protein